MAGEWLVLRDVIGKQGVDLVIPKAGAGSDNIDDAGAGGKERRSVARPLHGG